MSSKITKVVNLCTTPYLSMYDIKYINKVGQAKSWSATSRKEEETYKKRLLGKASKKDAVLIAAYHVNEQALVLVRQFRVPVNDYVYEIPAGLIDEGEDVVTCAKRELKEETGLNLKEIIKVYENLFISPGMTDECVDMVVATCDGDISYDHLEPDEDITIKLYKDEELKKLIVNKENMDIKTLMTVSMFLYGENCFWDL